MSFLKGFTVYKDVCPPGVRLPEINIEQKYYDQLGVESKISNLQF